MTRAAALVLLLVALTGCDPYVGYHGEHGEVCLAHDGWTRCWDEHVPDALTNAPLVIDMHGWLGRPDGQRGNSDLEAMANTEGFIVAWPYGLARSWNAGDGCCNPSARDVIDDVGFLRALVDQSIATWPVDPDRVYVTGLSNGCAMSQRFATEASDLVAAAACMAMVRLVETPAEYTSVPFMALHGTNDTVVPYDGDDFISAQANIEAWRDDNGCTGDAVTTWSEGEHAAETWTECANGTEVALVTIQDGGHVLYSGKGTDVDTTQVAWDFMSRFAR